MANVPEFFIKEWIFFFRYQLPSVHLLSMVQAWHWEQRQWKRLNLQSWFKFDILMYILWLVYKYFTNTYKKISIELFGLWFAILCTENFPWWGLQKCFNNCIKNKCKLSFPHVKSNSTPVHHKMRMGVDYIFVQISSLKRF